MGMTLTEKILAAHAGRDTVSTGEILMVRCDLMLGHDVTAPPAIKQFRALGMRRVHDPDRIVLVNDHFVPNKDVASAEQAKMMREFAREQGIRKYYEVGRSGVCHALLPEEGLVAPGDVVIGADSHTCTYGALGAFSTGVGSADLAAAWATGEIWLRVPPTMRFVYTGNRRKWVCGKDLILETIRRIGVEGARYRAMEFTGPAVNSLSIYDRFTMANMAVEAGAKNGIFEPDAAALEYLRARGARADVLLKSDTNAVFADTVEMDVSALGPVVACPSLPENVRPLADVQKEKVEIQQSFIGSCTNGWIEDLRVAAGLLRGRKVHPDVRCIVIPATQAIYRQALDEGLLSVFVDAGAVVSTPTCGPCLGGHMGILAAGETCIATTNRNFVGRMGHGDSRVYLSGPAAAAASAVLGYIAHPDAL